MEVPSVVEIATILARAPEALPWFYEGPCRHALRRTLILRGKSWGGADEAARTLVAKARLEARIRTPRGWDSDNDLSTWVQSADCPLCGRHFIPRASHRAQQIYCSRACANRASEIRIRLEGAWAQPVALRCGFCNEPLVDPHPNRRFCSTRCQHRAWLHLKYAKERPERLCASCGQPLPELGPTGRALKADAKVCGYDCELLRRKRAPRGNGHDHHEDAHGPPAAAGNGHARGGERGAGDRAAAGAGAPRAPRDDTEAGAAGGAEAGGAAGASRDRGRRGAARVSEDIELIEWARPFWGGGGDQHSDPEGLKPPPLPWDAA
jgi:hypothetical protein